MSTITVSKKYELTNENHTFEGITVHRIRALRDFDDVRAGALGGFIENETTSPMMAIAGSMIMLVFFAMLSFLITQKYVMMPLLLGGLKFMGMPWFVIRHGFLVKMLAFMTMQKLVTMLGPVV